MPSVWCVGCGDIGGGVAQVLHAAGWQVTGMRRHPREGVPYPQVAIDVLAPDLRERWAAYSAPDYVLYTVTPAMRTEAAYRDAYDHGVKRMLEALPAGVRRVVLVSSTGVYAQNAGEWVDETSVTVPTGFSGQALLAGEHHLQTAAVPGTVVRLSGIYGQDRQRNIQRLREGARIVREPPAYTNRIHQQDAIGFLVHLLVSDASGQALESLYVCSDDDPAPEWDVMCWLADWLGLPAPTEAASTGDQNKRCSNARLKASGYVLRHAGYREGYAAAFARLKDRPAG